ncbi:MAG: hypothetical protein WDN48_12550 [Pseudolabrys sp.]
MDYTVDSDCHFTARLFPVLRRTAGPPYRLLAFRCRRRHGPPGDLGQRQAALRRRPQARRALYCYAARRPAVGGARDAGQIGRVHDLVRDRKPFARFSGKAYVLPRAGQRGIPLLSVNTGAITLSLYRIGDRNLIDTVLGYDFQRNLSRNDAERIASERGAKVWGGETGRRAEAQHRSHHPAFRSTRRSRIWAPASTP